jgi:CubicO group peptidase (beta-lactamase class C family)
LQRVLELYTGQNFPNLVPSSLEQLGLGLTSIGFYNEQNSNPLLVRPTFIHDGKKYDLTSEDPRIRLGTADGGIMGSIEDLEKIFRSILSDQSFISKHNTTKEQTDLQGNMEYYGLGIFETVGDNPIFWHNGKIPASYGSIALFEPSSNSFLGVLRSLNCVDISRELAPIESSISDL